MEILLVLPNVFLGNRIGDHESKEPLGLLYLTSVLRNEGYQVSVLQADFYGLSVEQTAKIIQFHNPSVVGFSVTQRASVAALKIIDLLRKGGFTGHITTGGYLPTLCTEELLSYTNGIDSVVMGEGEITFLELVRCLDCGKDWQKIQGIAYKDNNEVIINEPRPAIEDLDSIPFPARDLLSDAFNRMEYATLISSRGCYGNCTFCSQNTFKRRNPGKRWRGRSPKNVVDEIEMLQTDYGIHTFKFDDDNIFGPGELGRQRIIGICEEIIKRKLKVNLMAYCRINDVNRETMLLMKEAGFERLLIGVESSIPSTLKKYKKGIAPRQIKEAFKQLTDLEFSVIPGFMMFNPYSNIDDLEKELYFLDSLQGYGVSISKTLKVHDGTPMKESLLKEGRLKLVPFIQGYHEYIIDNEVARVYKMLKIIWSKWLDPIQAEGQDIVTQIKKSESFKTRQEFDDYLCDSWKNEADLFLEIIKWVRSGKTTKKQMTLTLKDFYGKVIDLRRYLNSKITQGNLEARRYLLYPFSCKNENYCFDMVTSTIFTVDNPLQEALRILTSEQSTENLNYNTVEKMQDLERQGIIGHLPTKETIKLTEINELVELVWEAFNDYNLNTMTEKYFWG